jgi:hypothetical protein
MWYNWKSACAVNNRIRHGLAHFQKAMSALLSFLNIVDKKTFRQWSLKNHPDKCSADQREEATRKFQEVGAEYARVYEGDAGRAATPSSSSAPPSSHRKRPHPTSYTAPPKAKWSDPFMANRMSAEELRNMYAGTTRCGVKITGAPFGSCCLHRLPGKKTCFYHEPETDHLRFVDRPGMFTNLIYSWKARTSNMCTVKATSGRFCTKNKMKGKEECCMHHRLRGAIPTRK